jgi:mannosyl-oligosaccharide glucosidase
LDESKSAFTNLFKSVYAPKPPFDTPGYTTFSKAMLSNLLGGIGYFYGDSMADRAKLPEYEEKDLNFWTKVEQARSKAESEVVEPRELFSMVPSRQFFPRGFLWDEGFHLLVVLEWDLDLAMDIALSWFGLMDDDGWIAREQILGSELRSEVPPKFRVQYPQHANPPTLVLFVSALVDILAGNKTYTGHFSKYLDKPQLANDLLWSIYPLLNRHYQWFRSTQAGDLQSYARPDYSANEAYRWRGRTPDHTLASGLDDYPRAQQPHPGELHLDALSWVGSMAKALNHIAEYLGQSQDQGLFSRHLEAIKHNIEALHWSEDNQAYCDSTIDNSTHALVCHNGYVSLFPFLVGLMEPTNAHLKAVLGLIKNETELWSPFGVRSLSRQDEYYRTGDDYWRSPIWVNINFMILEQLLVSRRKLN